jgi:hypothetical protein
MAAFIGFDPGVGGVGFEIIWKVPPEFEVGRWVRLRQDTSVQLYDDDGNEERVAYIEAGTYGQIEGRSNEVVNIRMHRCEEAHGITISPQEVASMFVASDEPKPDRTAWQWLKEEE